jgi:hypothetical protein
MNAELRPRELAEALLPHFGGEELPSTEESCNAVFVEEEVRTDAPIVEAYLECYRHSMGSHRIEEI